MASPTRQSGGRRERRFLTWAGPLPATQRLDGEAIRAGHIYVAPPDHHLRVESGHVRVTRGPKENRLRPAVDVLFHLLAATPEASAASGPGGWCAHLATSGPRRAKSPLHC